MSFRSGWLGVAPLVGLISRQPRFDSATRLYIADVRNEDGLQNRLTGFDTSRRCSRTIPSLLNRRG